MDSLSSSEQPLLLQESTNLRAHGQEDRYVASEMGEHCGVRGVSMILGLLIDRSLPWTPCTHSKYKRSHHGWELHEQDEAPRSNALL